MNLSKLQSEAVLELSNLEVKVYNSKYDKYENGSAIIYVNKQAEKKVKQFLSDQIQKAVEETRKGMIKEIRKMETSSYTLDGAYLNENIDFICKKLK